MRMEQGSLIWQSYKTLYKSDTHTQTYLPYSNCQTSKSHFTTTTLFWFFVFTVILLALLTLQWKS